jgi:hypothetical protein
VNKIDKSLREPITVYDVYIEKSRVDVLDTATSHYVLANIARMHDEKWRLLCVSVCSLLRSMERLL